MNRRSFLSGIRNFVIGTVIALNIPDVLIPLGSNAEEFKAHWIELIDDFWFTESPLYKYIKSHMQSLEEFNPS